MCPQLWRGRWQSRHVAWLLDGAELRLPGSEEGALWGKESGRGRERKAQRWEAPAKCPGSGYGTRLAYHGGSLILIPSRRVHVRPGLLPGGPLFPSPPPRLALGCPVQLPLGPLDWGPGLSPG